MNTLAKLEDRLDYLLELPRTEAVMEAIETVMDLMDEYAEEMSYMTNN